MAVSAVKVSGFRGWLQLGTAWQLGLWLVLSLSLSVILFRQFWTSLPVMLSPSWVIGDRNASPWGVLALCLFFLWLKRKEVWREMSLRSTPGFIPVGLAMLVAAVLIPTSRDYLTFQVLLASLGVFAILFGRAAKIPSILLATYGLAISFPLAVQHFAEYAYSRTAIAPLIGLMTTLGYPIENLGQGIHLTTSYGDFISVAITAACAGPATMGVFIALFTLMMLDRPLSWRKGGWMFLFGAVGTWFQSFIRLLFILLMGYYWGEDALWTAHFWSIYILFPIWYLSFAHIYFRQVGRPYVAGAKQKLAYAVD
ncbi:MAG: exosortase/archaeosortase family protein [Dehalococcoidia bacterium]